MRFFKIFLLLFILKTPVVLATEANDIYLMANAGVKTKKSETSFLFSFSGGYAFMDVWGMGVSVSQSNAFDNQNDEKSSFYVGLESRWFFEPIEFSVSAGATQLESTSLDPNKWYPLIEGQATYEWALLEALTFRFSLHAELPLTSALDTSFGATVGFRYLF